VHECRWRRAAKIILPTNDGSGNTAQFLSFESQCRRAGVLPVRRQ